MNRGGANSTQGKYEHNDDDSGAGNDKDQINIIEPTIRLA